GSRDSQAGGSFFLVTARRRGSFAEELAPCCEGLHGQVGRACRVAIRNKMPAITPRIPGDGTSSNVNNANHTVTAQPSHDPGVMPLPASVHWRMPSKIEGIAKLPMLAQKTTAFCNASMLGCATLSGTAAQRPWVTQSSIADPRKIIMRTRWPTPSVMRSAEPIRCKTLVAITGFSECGSLVVSSRNLRVFAWNVRSRNERRSDRPCASEEIDPASITFELVECRCRVSHECSRSLPRARDCRSRVAALHRARCADAPPHRGCQRSQIWPSVSTWATPRQIAVG